MTVRGLLNFFENYYGEKYSGVFLDAMASYLDNCSEDFLKSCANVIIMRFSRIYNKVPDPSIIEKHMDEIIALLPKSEPLPEPEGERATPEETERFLAEMHRLFKNKTPIGNSLMKTINSFGG